MAAEPEDQWPGRREPPIGRQVSHEAPSRFVGPSAKDAAFDQFGARLRSATQACGESGVYHPLDSSGDLLIMYARRRGDLPNPRFRERRDLLIARRQAASSQLAILPAALSVVRLQ